MRGTLVHRPPTLTLCHDALPVLLDAFTKLLNAKMDSRLPARGGGRLAVTSGPAFHMGLLCRGLPGIISNIPHYRQAGCYPLIYFYSQQC